MNHGCTITTQKQSSSFCNGRRRPLRKKCAKFTATSSQCRSFFFDIRGIVHKEFVPPGQTVNGNFYCKVFGQLRENVGCKWPETWKNRDWLLHHDNAPAHTSLVVRELLTKNNMTTVPHPAYSPNLSPCDFYMFRKMKLRLKGQRFVSIEEIHAELQQALNMLTLADFNECF